MSQSKTFLNPNASLDILKERLAVTEHYRLRHGVEFAYWPHYFLRNVGAHLYRYKFNYLAKGLVFYSAYSILREHRHLNKHAILTMDQNAFYAVSFCATAATGVVLSLLV